MYAEDDLLPISALQHLLFCDRQCALIHIEGLWAENRLTVEGRYVHDRAHGGERESRRTGSGEHVRILRGVPVRSLVLGLIGVADVVEMHSLDDDACAPRHFPVEYKRGQPKRADFDRVQLCAQALCLEETLGTEVPAGALYYHRIRRREDVAFSAALREKTRATAMKLRELIAAGVTPKVRKQPKCRRCSLRDLCMPAGTYNRSAAGYLRRSIEQNLAADGFTGPTDDAVDMS
jgi:CRISPR-associated exonuclease Cas4